MNPLPSYEELDLPSYESVVSSSAADSEETSDGRFTLEENNPRFFASTFHDTGGNGEDSETNEVRHSFIHAPNDESIKKFRKKMRVFLVVGTLLFLYLFILFRGHNRSFLLLKLAIPVWMLGICVVCGYRKPDSTSRDTDECHV